MKITPLEIRQKSFEKIFRGYDKDEVNAFLQILSEEWEKMQSEKRELSIKLEGAEREISKLREVETSLYKTLKTAEDTGASMIEQANKAAILKLRETELTTDNLLRDARNKANTIVDSAEKRARDIITKMLTEIQSLETNFNAALSLKENLIADLTNLSSSTLERAQKFKKQKDKLDIEKYIKEAREFAENYDPKKIGQTAKEETKDTEKEASQIAITFEKKEHAPRKENSEKSFFDMLD
jgi:cell division initiation protein